MHAKGAKTMLTIKHRGYLYQWAFWLTAPWSCPFPNQATNLCALFWRTVVVTPAKIVAIGVILGILVLAHIEEAILGWFFVLVPWIMVGAVFGGIWCAGKGKEASPIKETIHGIKERYCPIVRVEE